MNNLKGFCLVIIQWCLIHLYFIWLYDVLTDTNIQYWATKSLRQFEQGY